MMINRKGQTETPSLTTGLVIMVLILAAIGLIIYLIAQKNVTVQSRVVFEDFLKSYQNCTAYDVNDCYCEPLSLQLLSDDYTIRVVDLEGDMLAFELLEEDEQRLRVTAPGSALCTYVYLKSSNQLQSDVAPQLTFGTLGMRGELVLVRSEGQVCFASGLKGSGLQNDIYLTETVDAIRRMMNSCASVVAQQPPALRKLIGLLQLDQEGSTRQPSYSPNPQLITLGDLLYRQDEGLTRLTPVHKFMTLFEDHYLEKLLRVVPDGDFASRSYVVSLRSVTEDSAGDGKDVIILKYLEPSLQSKRFAEHLQRELAALDGAYYNGRLLLGREDTSLFPSDLPSINLLSLRVELESVPDKSYAIYLPEILVLEDDGPLYQQRYDIPAVFIEFVDYQNGSPLLEHHYEIISDTITRGVESYLHELTPPSSR